MERMCKACNSTSSHPARERGMSIFFWSGTVRYNSVRHILCVRTYGTRFLVQLNSWNNSAHFTTCHESQKRILLLEAPKGTSSHKRRNNWTSLLVVKAHNFLLIFWIPNGDHPSNKYNFFLFQAFATLFVFLRYSSWPPPKKTQSFLFVSLSNSIKKSTKHTTTNYWSNLQALNDSPIQQQSS